MFEKNENRDLCELMGIVAEDDYYPLESEIDESAEVIEYEENGEIK